MPRNTEKQKHLERKNNAEKVKTELVRDVVHKIVLAILDHSSPIEIEGYKKAIDWNHPPKKFGKKKKYMFDVSGAYDSVGNKEVRRDKFKKVIHDGLQTVGIKKTDTTKSRITTAIAATSGIYTHFDKHTQETYTISHDDFMTRIHDGRFTDDIRMLFGVRLLMRGQQKDDRINTLENFFSDGNFMRLKESPANNALYEIIQTGRQVLTDTEFENMKKIMHDVSDHIPMGIDFKKKGKKK